MEMHSCTGATPCGCEGLTCLVPGVPGQAGGCCACIVMSNECDDDLDTASPCVLDAQWWLCSQQWAELLSLIHITRALKHTRQWGFTHNMSIDGTPDRACC